MQLNPGEFFTVVRELADPNDSGTYYVQAKVRNARTGDLLATLNLADQTGQRFTKEYQVPQDVSGLGFYISISTRVYTDSGYSSLSDAYGQESETYLVDQRNRAMGGGGGGDDVNYKKIRDILKEELAGFDIGEIDLTKVMTELRKIVAFRDATFPVIKEIQANVASVGKNISGVDAVLSRIEKKEMPKLDLTPVLKAIDELPKFEATDLSQVLAAIKGMHDALRTADLEKIVAKFPDIADSVKKIDENAKSIVVAIGKMGPELERIVEDSMYSIAKQEGKKEPKEEVQKPDYQAQAREMIGGKK